MVSWFHKNIKKETNPSLCTMPRLFLSDEYMHMKLGILIQLAVSV